MATTAVISQRELERIAALAYQGETLKVMLCSVGSTGYTGNSTVANWQSVEKSGNGYVRYSELIGTGSYDPADGRYELPLIDAEFTASGDGYSYDRIVLYIDGETYVHSVITESPGITLVSGQTQVYRLQLNTDN